MDDFVACCNIESGQEEEDEERDGEERVERSHVLVWCVIFCANKNGNI